MQQPRKPIACVSRHERAEECREQKGEKTGTPRALPKPANLPASRSCLSSAKASFSGFACSIPSQIPVQT